MTAALWANIIAIPSMLATVIATGVAWFQATKSRNAARDAEEALAEVLRPEFVPRVRPNGKAGFHVELDNAARHDALDVEFEVRHPDSQKLAGGSVHRASGQVPNTWAGDPAINATILGLPVLEEVGASFDLVIVLWFSDERGRHRWRQELRTTQTLTEQDGRTRIKSQHHPALPVRLHDPAAS